MVKASQKFGFPIVRNIGKPNKRWPSCFWTIEKPNFKMSSFSMCSVVQCSIPHCRSFSYNNINGCQPSCSQ